MVIEAKSIKGSSKGLKYQADDKGLSKEILRSEFLVGNEPKDWHKQMQETESKNGRVENNRFSIVIAPSKEVSKNLTDDDWKNLAKNYFNKMGIDASNHQFIAHLHTSTDDPHLHITFSRIPFADITTKYTAINDNHIGTKSGTIANKIAKENGWKTAKEISQGKRYSIGLALKIVLKTAKNFDELSQAMQTHGFLVQLSENEAKGIYGMRIIPIADINVNPSERAQNSKQGYKLSEIERQEGRKAKFRVADVKISLERNAFKAMSQQEKVDFAQSKKEKLFGAESKPSENILTNTSSNKEDKSIIDILLTPSYTESSNEDVTKKKRKKKR